MLDIACIAERLPIHQYAFGTYGAIRIIFRYNERHFSGRENSIQRATVPEMGNVLLPRNIPLRKKFRVTQVQKGAV